MSVNEVKLKVTPPTFEVRGTGPPNNRTFAIGNEDHTLGNSLRHILVRNSEVGFAGYSVPHPSEPVVHIRVQTHKETGVTAVEALQEACETLIHQCQVVLDKLEDEIPEVRQDREALDEEMRRLEEEEEEEDDNDNNDDGGNEEGMENAEAGEGDYMEE